MTQKAKAMSSLFEHAVSPREWKMENRRLLDEFFIERTALGEAAKDLDFHWWEYFSLPESNDIDWHRPIGLIYAEDIFSNSWGQAEMSLGAVGSLTQNFGVVSQKNAFAIALCTLAANEEGLFTRGYRNLASATGFVQDNDGVWSFEEMSCAAADSRNLTFLHTTPSHGKTFEVINAAAFHAHQRRMKGSLSMTNEEVADYLNSPHFPERPYQDVSIFQVTSDSILVKFRPLSRVRGLTPYSRPIPKPLIKAILAHEKGAERLGRPLEREVYSRNGGDPATFKPTQPAFLPSIIRGRQPPPGFEPRSIVVGNRLLDPVPFAERVLAELEAERARRPMRAPITTAKSCDGPVPAPLQQTLRGVRLGAMIATNHPELLHDDRDADRDEFNYDHPLHLACCPFADEHGSKRGQADGSLYIIDPDGGEYLYPTVKCRHANTCGSRKLGEFVSALIDSGDVTWGEVYADPAFRDVYEYLYDGPTTFGGLDLMKWIKRYGKSFQIEKLAGARGLIANHCEWGGVTLTTGHYARDPRDGKGFVLGPDRVESLIALLSDNRITVEDLKCRSYGGGFESRMAVVEYEPSF